MKPQARQSQTKSAFRFPCNLSGSQAREPDEQSQNSSVHDVLAGSSLGKIVMDTRILRSFVGLPGPGARQIAGKSKGRFCRGALCLRPNAFSLAETLLRPGQVAPADWFYVEFHGRLYCKG